MVGRAAASARVERGWGAEVDPPAAGEIVRCVEWVHMKKKTFRIIGYTTSPPVRYSDSVPPPLITPPPRPDHR